MDLKVMRMPSRMRSPEPERTGLKVTMLRYCGPRCSRCSSHLSATSNRLDDLRSHAQQMAAGQRPSHQRVRRFWSIV